MAGLYSNYEISPLATRSNVTDSTIWIVTQVAPYQKLQLLSSRISHQNLRKGHIKIAFHCTME
jgi:hypothetical protein